ncbi:uncharacterized protein LAESUDRAFT_218759 [Laetiporus sulphureus 93-53]|uniref:Uncharacterized protein n=1 Tax=Laetiporus sulphureus 93-53 TaxID=1314785 RepID=A0A165DSM3_9APHY|nr:uncharacterized protein LAESUDRAFT_218759 [Laetiporus sulphureus 93-53]KZT05547.1 hypothetical protein LAESUDRAFT_218759 [Laetiporus sulphureus 93-53]
MPVQRRRPLCHTCGSPMVGHKRPNGILVCPSPDLTPRPSPARLTRNDAVSTFDTIPENGVWHRRNPNWREPEPSPLIDEAGRNPSWVPTERDGCTPLDGIDDDKHWEQEEDAESDMTPTATPSRVLGRTISQALIDSIPLASLFTTSTRDLPIIRDVADRHGLTMGVVPSPNYKRGPEIKREDGESSHARNLGRQHSWWLVMGRDKAAVSHLLDVHERDAGVESGANRMTFLDVLIAGVIGGLVVFYGLSVL